MRRKGQKLVIRMKWRKPKAGHPRSGTTRLKEFLNPTHPLYRLARGLNWPQFESPFGKFYTEGMGRPAIAPRVMIGLHYLKHLYNVSDKVVVASWVENPYWQYFCGGEYFAHEVPCDPTSLVKWRQRVSAEGIEKLLKESLAAAQRAAVLTATEVQRVNCGYDCARESDYFPDRCAAVSQGSASVGAASAELRLEVTPKLRTAGEARVGEPGTVWRGAAAQAGTA